MVTTNTLNSETLQNGDSAVIRAITSDYSKPEVLRELVRARSNLNLQNQVRYTITVNTAPHIIPCCPLLGGTDGTDDCCQE